MNYDCTLASVDKLMLDPMGVRQPLCNDCKAPDCSNPIKEKTVYIVGKPYTHRLYVVNNVVKQVVSCKGHVGKSNVVLPSIEEVLESPSISIGRNDKESEQNNQE